MNIFIDDFMKRQRSKKPEYQKTIAKERIQILFDLANKSIGKHPERGRRYVELARKIGLRYNLRLTKEQKRSFCKKCNSLLIEGKTSEVSKDPEKKVLIIKCLNCNNIYKRPYE